MAYKLAKNVIKSIDPSQQALAMMGCHTAANHKGALFGAHYRGTIGVGEANAVYFVMKTSASKVSHVLAPFISGNRTCYIDYYKGATYDDQEGTQINAISNNHRHSRVSTSQDFRIGLAAMITDIGTHFFPDTLTAGKFSAGAAGTTIGWELLLDTAYVGKVVNQDAQDGYLNFNMFWIEEDIF